MEPENGAGALVVTFSMHYRRIISVLRRAAANLFIPLPLDAAQGGGIFFARSVARADERRPAVVGGFLMRSLSTDSSSCRF